MLGCRILVRDLAHASVAFEEETEDAQSQRCLERDEDGAEPLDFVEHIRLRLIQLHQLFDVDRAIYFFIVVGVHLYGFNY